MYKTGLRSFMEYRDLGIERATHGKFRAHVIRIKADAGGAHELQHATVVVDRIPEAAAAR